MKILLIFFICIFVICKEAYSEVRITNAGAGCPDNFCIWIQGENLGNKPFVTVFDGDSPIGYYRNTNVSKENGRESLSFMLNTSQQMDLFEKKSLEIQVYNSEIKKFSQIYEVNRSGARTAQVRGKKAILPLKVGGTNFVTYDLGDYLKNHSLWGDSERGVKMVIARYHEDKERVNELIRNIYLSGQKVISLMVWFVIYPEAQNNIHMHTIDISNGVTKIHQNNLKEILQEIKKYKFEKVILRMGPQGNESPESWKKWEEDNYKIQWSAINTLIDITQNELKRTRIEPLFDLAGELGGLNYNPHQEMYAVRLWRDYLREYGNYNSVAFSFAYYPGRVTNLVKLFKKNKLPLPKSFAVDIYGAEDFDSNFYRLAKELQSQNLLSKPIILMETYYNDPIIMKAVIKAREQFGLNITRIIQWNLTREGDLNGDKHFSVLDPTEYSHYLFETK